MNIGQEPGKDELIRDIDSEDLLRVQPFQRRRRYRLFVGFLEGTMIHPVDAPVEFEISIGKPTTRKYSIICLLSLLRS